MHGQQNVKKYFCVLRSVLKSAALFVLLSFVRRVLIIAKSDVSFVMCVRLPACKNLVPTGTDFHEIYCLLIFRKICRENSRFIKI